eukprot:9908301-Heterocapsa_arctica.AAC.1
MSSSSSRSSSSGGGGGGSSSNNSSSSSSSPFLSLRIGLSNSECVYKYSCFVGNAMVMARKSGKTLF